jgi:SAM-dependent methyltransferase
MNGRPRGGRPGPVGGDAAPDGSPIDVYRRLPTLGEGDRVAAAVPAGASVLELGCGTGRVTAQLVRRGLSVTAVDESAAMLAHVRDAEPVCATIEGLDLGRRFDAVVLASNLVNAEPERRRAFLEACVRHSDTVVLEGLPLSWRPHDGESRLGPFTSRLRVASLDGDVVRGEVEYDDGARTWRHAFAMHVFADAAAFDAALDASGLRRVRWLDDERRWCVAKAVTALDVFADDDGSKR